MKRHRIEIGGRAMRCFYLCALTIFSIALAGCVSPEERAAARAADASFTENAVHGASPEILAQCMKAAQEKMKEASYEQKGPLKPSPPATRWIERHSGFPDNRPKPSHGGDLVVFVAPVDVKNLLGMTIHTHIGCSYERVDNKFVLLQGLGTPDFIEINSLCVKIFQE